MNALVFTKMQALGNDFVVIDGVKQTVNLSSSFIKETADRHFGIGFDQLLLIEPSKNPEADFYYRIFNADGSEVNQCGNGARCVALFVNTYDLSPKKNLVFQTHNSLIECHILENGWVRVNMGIPEQTPSKIPFIANTSQIRYSLKVDSLNEHFEICPLSVGNPHCVLWLESFENLAIDTIGALLSKHPSFPEGTNVEFVKICDRQSITLRVFERGVGETLACGSAACASVVASQLVGLVDNTVEVSMPGGKLTVQWTGKNAPIWLTGPASFVFEGKMAF